MLIKLRSTLRATEDSSNLGGLTKICLKFGHLVIWGLKSCIKRQSFSVETDLYPTVFSIERALNAKCFSFGTFMDIEGAFENTQFRSIRNSMVFKMD